MTVHWASTPKGKGQLYSIFFTIITSKYQDPGNRKKLINSFKISHFPLPRSFMAPDS